MPVTEPMTDERRAEIHALAVRARNHGKEAVASALFTLLAENERLIRAVRKHHDQKADDRCWLDDCDLYLAAGLPDHNAQVGDRAAMLANCKRFIEQRCGSGGPWKSYVELEAEVERLSRQLAECWGYLQHAADGHHGAQDAYELLRRHGQLK